jgi:sugar lactone lactonase YvrE
MRIVFTEELSIGEAEGDENYMFGNSIAFNTDDEGNFYVADFDSNRILKYDPEGKHLLTIGREGQGPGEFRTLSVPRFDKDNNLYITDSMNQRVSFFDQDGKYIAHFKTLVPLFFSKNGKAYDVADEDGCKFVKRCSFEIQE